MGKEKFSAADIAANQKIGSKLRYFRESLGWTLDETAAKLNRSKGHIFNLEKGVTSLSAKDQEVYFSLGLNLACLYSDDEPIERVEPTKRDLLLDTKTIINRLSQVIEQNNGLRTAVHNLTTRVEYLEKELKKVAISH